jgi:hypothetical protein
MDGLGRPNYATNYRMIENPIYGGAYAYGKRPLPQAMIG